LLRRRYPVFAVLAGRTLWTLRPWRACGPGGTGITLGAGLPLVSFWTRATGHGQCKAGRYNEKWAHIHPRSTRTTRPTLVEQGKFRQ
jgi:hypothetical protein